MISRQIFFKPVLIAKGSAKLNVRIYLAIEQATFFFEGKLRLKREKKVVRSHSWKWMTAMREEKKYRKVCFATISSQFLLVMPHFGLLIQSCFLHGLLPLRPAVVLRGTARLAVVILPIENGCSHTGIDGVTRIHPGAYRGRTHHDDSILKVDGCR